ncbi:MAG: hypothetical protein JWR80_6693 [Bradyrhizobium sp.]|nr:hypothetical protein [Bradyrhizobium sp.]
MLALRLRARLASFAHAYAVAVQRRNDTGDAQFVTQTANPLQPYRVSASPPEASETLLTLII